jgi:hypothetical protein
MRAKVKMASIMHLDRDLEGAAQALEDRNEVTGGNQETIGGIGPECYGYDVQALSLSTAVMLFTPSHHCETSVIIERGLAVTIAFIIFFLLSKSPSEVGLLTPGKKFAAQNQTIWDYSHEADSVIDVRKVVCGLASPMTLV